MNDSFWVKALPPHVFDLNQIKSGESKFEDLKVDQRKNEMFIFYFAVR